MDDAGDCEDESCKGEEELHFVMRRVEVLR
jgi:hypothetical protein